MDLMDISGICSMDEGLDGEEGGFLFFFDEDNIIIFINLDL